MYVFIFNICVSSIYIQYLPIYYIYVQLLKIMDGIIHTDFVPFRQTHGNYNINLKIT